MNTFNRRFFAKWIVCLGCVAALPGCKHPLAIVGEGDIVDANGSGHGCSLEQYRANDAACSRNTASDDYFVNYRAEPRPGWRFVRWEGPCAPNSDFQHCRLDVSRAAVAWWDETYPETEIPPSTAVFQPITGKSGVLLAGTPVAGVAYETPTQQGVTGLDGRFQYGPGETVRFKIGDTLLGAVTGRARVTPFELIGAPVMTSLQISQQQAPPEITGWNSVYPASSFQWSDYDPYAEYVPDDFFYTPAPFHNLVNLTVLLQSLDADAEPGNGIVIRAGVAELFRNVSLELRQEWESFLGNPESQWGPGGFPTLRYLLQQASRQQRFAVPHGVVKLALALQRLYRALGLDARTFAACPGGFQSTGNNVDCGFDARGNMTWLHLNSWGGGVTTNYQYDANGAMTRAEENWTERQSVWTWEYDANGNPVRSVWTEGWDDDDNPGGNTERWLYDKNGNVLRYEEDGDSDGTVDQFADWHYDAMGRPTRFESRHPGRGADWGLKRWEYFANGKLARYKDAFYVEGNGHNSVQQWEYNAGGKLTRYYSENAQTREGFHWIKVESREYDAQGNFTQTSYASENGELSLRRIARVQFDADGHLLRYTRDYNGDGKPEKVESWQYEKSGKVARYECSAWCGDVPAFVELWQYDENGKPTRAERRDGGGRVFHTRTWQYATNGRPARYEEDENGDGAPDSVQSWEYDASGNLIRHENNQSNGGLLIETWLIDADGSLIRFERSNDVPEFPSQAGSWQYHTTGWGHLFSGPNLWWLYY